MSRRERKSGDRETSPAGDWPIAAGTATLTNEPVGSSGWLLAIDGVPQSHVDLGDPTVLVFEYIRWIGSLLDCLAGPGEDLHTVHVGTGAGTLARYVAATRPGSRQVLIDSDGPLLNLMRDTLGLRSGPYLKLRTVDGRAGLAAVRAASYDVVIRDAFADTVTPHALSTTQWCDVVVRALRPGGVLVCNLSDATPFDRTRAEVATLQGYFDRVLAVAEPGTLRGRRTGNVVLVASDADLPVPAWSRRLAGDAATPVRLLDEASVRDRFGGGEALMDDGPVLRAPPRPTWS